MGQLGQRIIALSGAIMFFLTTIALTVVVIVTMIQESKNPDTNAAQTAATTCDIGSEPTEETLPEPEPFKAEGPVRELQKTDLEEGSGATAEPGDCLIMKYYGTLASDGTKFDENFTQPNALRFELGRGQVISGWDEGLAGMKVGGTRRLVIPADKAYGEQSPSERIPANSDLVFVVKLMDIKEL